MPGSLTRRLSRILPIIEWGGGYQRSDIKGDVASGELRPVEDAQ
jgi:hypothetical protein